MGLLEHAGFTVEGDEAGGEAFLGHVVGVVFLVVEDFFDPSEFLGGGEAADGGGVDARLGAEAGVVGGGLEFVDEGAEVAFFVEGGGEGLHGGGIGRWGCGGRGGECAADEAGEGRHGWWWWWRRN